MIKIIWKNYANWFFLAFFLDFEWIKKSLLICLSDFLAHFSWGNFTSNFQQRHRKFNVIGLKKFLAICRGKTFEFDRRASRRSFFETNYRKTSRNSRLLVTVSWVKSSPPFTSLNLKISHLQNESISIAIKRSLKHKSQNVLLNNPNEKLQQRSTRLCCLYSQSNTHR